MEIIIIALFAAFISGGGDTTAKVDMPSTTIETELTNQELFLQTFHGDK